METPSRHIAASRETAAPITEARARPGFQELYEGQFEFVWRCLRRLGVDVSQLDDATQDVFLVVHRRLPDYEPRVSPRAWLFAITRRVAHDYRRTASRKGGGVALTEQHATRDLDPHQRAMESQTAHIVMRFLDTLPEPQREAFILSELEQLSSLEIAAAVSAKVNTVYTRVHAARQALARFLRKHYPDLSDGRGGHHGR